MWSSVFLSFNYYCLWQHDGANHFNDVLLLLLLLLLAFSWLVIVMVVVVVVVVSVFVVVFIHFYFGLNFFFHSSEKEIQKKNSDKVSVGTVCYLPSSGTACNGGTERWTDVFRNFICAKAINTKTTPGTKTGNAKMCETKRNRERGRKPLACLSWICKSAGIGYILKNPSWTLCDIFSVFSVFNPPAQAHACRCLRLCVYILTSVNEKTNRNGVKINISNVALKVLSFFLWFARSFVCCVGIFAALSLLLPLLLLILLHIVRFVCVSLFFGWS